MLLRALLGTRLCFTSGTMAPLSTRLWIGHQTPLSTRLWIGRQTPLGPLTNRPVSGCRHLSTSVSVWQKAEDDAPIIAIQYDAHTRKPVRTFYRTADARWHWTEAKESVEESVAERQRPFGSYPRVSWRYWMHFILPEQYPLSIGPGYPRYQSWLFLQWVLQSFTYVFTTYALLSSVGVNNAMPLSAAMNWVLKDGLGCVGMMMSASLLGGLVDVNPKRTKWLSDAVFHAGVGIELALLLLPRGDPLLWIVCASVANALKATAGLIGGACRASINQTFALRQNLGDITAKAQAQSTLAYLVGMMGSLPLSQLIGESTPSVFGAVGFFTVAALFSSYRALSSVPIRTLNFTRAGILFRDYSASPADDGLSPEAVRRRESFLLPPRLFTGRLASAKLLFGSTLERAFSSPDQFARTAAAFAGQRYLLCLRSDQHQHVKEAHVVLHTDATAHDQLKALWHCFTIDRSTAAQHADDVQQLAVDTLAAVDADFPSLLQRVQADQWNTERVYFTTSDSRVSWQ